MSWFLYDSDGIPLTLSGSNVETRPAILRQMVTQLGRSGPGQPSLLDQELRQIADETRRRALLLVGSYREATMAADLLEAMPRWRGRVKVLAADDADLDHAVKFAEREIRWHQNAPPHHGAYPNQPDLDLHD